MAFCFSLFNSSDCSVRAISIIRAQTFGGLAKSASNQNPRLGLSVSNKAVHSKPTSSYNIHGRRVDTNNERNQFKATSILQFKKKLKKTVTIENVDFTQRQAYVKSLTKPRLELSKQKSSPVIRSSEHSPLKKNED